MTWNVAQGNPPRPVGDCRKLVWLVDKDGMAWVGIRAYHHGEGYWYVGNMREESANVTHWMDLPDRPDARLTAAPEAQPEGEAKQIQEAWIELMANLAAVHLPRPAVSASSPETDRTA